MVLLKKVGRAKIPITWIKSDASRHVTFTKRKKGLKKKVEELAILCGVEVCMICFSPQAGKPCSAPYSWGLPGVSQVINKYQSLSKEEQDKKKLDNTSLLEQQIKKLKSELKLKIEQNHNKETERAYVLWDDWLNGYGVDELKPLADIVLERTREAYDRIAFLSQQQQEVLQGFGNVIQMDSRNVSLADSNFNPGSSTLLGNNALNGDLEILTSCPISNHEQLIISSQGPFQQQLFGDNPSNDLLMNQNLQGLFNQMPLSNLPFFIPDDQKSNVMLGPTNSLPVSTSNYLQSNLFINPNSILPLSTDVTSCAAVRNPLKLMSSSPQENLEPHFVNTASIQPTLLKSKLCELVEPHLLSDIAWQQAVGLQTDPYNFGGAIAAYSCSSSSQELQVQESGEQQQQQQQQEEQWSDDMNGEEEEVKAHREWATDEEDCKTMGDQRVKEGGPMSAIGNTVMVATLQRDGDGEVEAASATECGCVLMV